MDGIAWAASAMVAARTRLEIAAGNLANASTDGFTRTLARGVLTPAGVAIVRSASPAHGALRHTGSAFDLAISGDGAFSVRDGHGAVTRTRNGAFVRERDGTLRDPAGRTLLASSGAALIVPEGARFDASGVLRLDNRAIGRIALPPGSRLQSGFLETSGVDAIAEMVDVLCAERSFESAQKVVSAIDQTREKAADDVARLK
jgi:flagellar basal body rod protein FlgG